MVNQAHRFAHLCFYRHAAKMLLGQCGSKKKHKTCRAAARPEQGKKEWHARPADAAVNRDLELIHRRHQHALDLHSFRH